VYRKKQQGADPGGKDLAGVHGVGTELAGQMKIRENKNQTRTDAKKRSYGVKAIEHVDKKRGQSNETEKQQEKGRDRRPKNSPASRTAQKRPHPPQRFRTHATHTTKKTDVIKKSD